MKLKFLFKLNALLIICSLFFNIFTQTNKKKELNKSTTDDIYKANDEHINKMNNEKINVASLEDHKVMIEAKPVVAASPVQKFSLKKLVNAGLKTDPKSLQKIVEYKKCKIKTGVIDYVKLYDFSKSILTVIPSIVSVNRNSINFFENSDTKSLFATVAFDSISKISTKFPGTNCLTFVKKIEDGHEKDSVTMCAKTEKEKEEWINSLTEFKECGLHVEENKDNVIFDFNKINTLLRDRKNKEQYVIKQELDKIGTVSPDGTKIMPHGSKKFVPLATLHSDTSPEALKIRKGLEKSRITLVGNKIVVNSKDLNVGGQSEDYIKELYYDNSAKVNRKSAITEAKDLQLQKEVKKILTDIKQGKIAQQQIERKMRCEINKAEKIKTDIQKQKNLIKNLVEEREQKARQRNVILGQKLSSNKEIQLMKAVGLQIKRINKAQLKEKKQQLKTTLRSIKGVTHTEKKQQEKIIQDSSKLTNFDSCINNEFLYNFKNLKYVNKICKSYYGESQKVECADKRNFCTMCCNFHIGSSYSNKRIDCKNQCQLIVNGNSLKNSRKNKNRN